MTSSIDVLIVGSGIVGSSFARLLAEHSPRSSVLMVDAGPALTDPPGTNVTNLPTPAQATARLEAQGPNRGIPHVGTSTRFPNDSRSPLPGLHLADPAGGMPGAAMATCAGGMGSFWSCATPRPNDTERSGLFSPDRWSTAFREAERLLGTTDRFQAESAGGAHIRATVAKLLAPELPPGRDIDILPMAARPLSSGGYHWCGADDVLRPAERRHGRFALKTETLCRSLIHSGDTVTGALLEHLPTGETAEIRARAVVLAADALRTPQLLWASGIRPSALGRYLNEHPVSWAVLRLDPRAAPGMTEKEKNSLIVSASRIPFADPGHPYHAQIIQTSQCTVPAELTGPLSSTTGFAVLSWMGRKRPRPDDRVAFAADRTDWCGMPTMKIEYALTEDDRAEVEGGLRHLEQCADALGECVPFGEPRTAPPGASLHYQGTVRAGQFPDDTSVCDRYGRVWRYRNLFVGGNGVIPTTTACNPTLTSVAYAALAVPELVKVIA